MSGIIEFTAHSDQRGRLVALTGGGEVPFQIKRVFYIYGNKGGLPRAGHAHEVTTELLVGLHGSCRAVIEDESGRRTVTLDRPDRGFLLEPMTWLELTDFTPDCVLLVLADAEYLPHTTINDLNEFRERVR